MYTTEMVGTIKGMLLIKLLINLMHSWSKTNEAFVRWYSSLYMFPWMSLTITIMLEDYIPQLFPDPWWQNLTTSLCRNWDSNCNKDPMVSIIKVVMLMKFFWNFFFKLFILVSLLRSWDTSSVKCVSKLSIVLCTIWKDFSTMAIKQNADVCKWALGLPTVFVCIFYFLF